MAAVKVETFGPDDEVLRQPAFLRDEVTLNLLHTICEADDALRLKTAAGDALLAQTPGQHAWLWIAGGRSAGERAAIGQALCEALPEAALPGATGESGTAAGFARLYAAGRALDCRIHMEMAAYSCPRAAPPAAPAGKPRPARADDVGAVAAFLAGFAREAYGLPATPSGQKQAAGRLIGAGGLLLWDVGGVPAAMAGIAHRSPRQLRINAVYTAPDMRGRGYAGALTAALCAIAEREGRLPMLYADRSNAAANRAYRKIGFVESGSVTSYKFGPPAASP